MGFQYMLIANGHGSNHILLEVVARLETVRTSLKYASFSYWQLASDAVDRLRESKFPGGMSHACEFETSVYMHPDPEHVQHDRIQREVWHSGSDLIWTDLLASSPVRFADWWSARSKTVHGRNACWTRAGLRGVGVALEGVTGIAWRPEVLGLAQRLAALADATGRLLNIENPLTAPDFVTLDYGGPEYGVPSPETWEALALCARTDGLFVDPVYSGKGMAGLIDQIRRGFLEVRDLVVFVRTGGVPALFAYADAAVDSHAFKDAFASGRTALRLKARSS